MTPLRYLCADMPARFRAIALFVAVATLPVTAVPQPAASGDLPQVTRESLTKTCESGIALDCLDLGAMWDLGDGGPVDQAVARKYYINACDGDVAIGCYNIGDMLCHGDGGPLDVTAGRGYFGRACDMSYAAACLTLGEMIMDGIGGPIDVKQAIVMYKKACDLGDSEACTEVSAADDGTTGPADHATGSAAGQTGGSTTPAFPAASTADR